MVAEAAAGKKAEKEGMREMRAKAVPREASMEAKPVKTSGVKSITGADFEGRAGSRLQLRLQHFGKLDRYRVRWVRLARKGAKHGSAQGYCADEPDVERGRAAFDAAVTRAMAAGWKNVPMFRGGRGVQIKEIPAP